MSIEDAQQRKVSTMYNYIYFGESLFFVGYEISNFVIKVKDNLIIKVHFEIQYSDKRIFDDLINEFGYPDVGHINSDLPFMENSEKDRNDRDNYLYENYTGLTWSKDEKDTYMSITNLKNNNYFIDKKSTLWIDFRIVK